MRDISSPLDGIASPFGPQRTKTLTQLLFASSEPGFTFEPWDITTLYQDRAGTTPVTAAGQSVGLRLDKSKGLALGPELVTNGTFDTDLSGWTNLSGAFVWANGKAASTGITGDLLQTGGTIGTYYTCSFTVSNSSGLGVYVSLVGVDIGYFTDGTYTRKIVCAAADKKFRARIFAGSGGSLDNISVRELAGNHEVAVSDAKRGVYGWMPKTGRRNLLNATDALSTQSVTVTAVAHTLAFTGTGTVTLSGASTAGPLVGTGASNRVTLTFTPTAGSLTLTVSGSVTLAQLELGSTATAYQRVVSQYDITEAGVPTCYYVQADGVDDAYMTPTITPNTDKVQVFAGVRKLSDAASGIFIEHSASLGANNGAFAVTAPLNAAGSTFGFGSKGTAFAAWSVSGASFNAPVSAVLTGIGDISADAQILRLNGSQIQNLSNDQGTGNYLAYPAYIYSRGGTASPFNGLDFGHAVRFGPNLDAATIARVEALIARNTPGVTL